MIKKKTPIKQNKNFFIILFASVLILGLSFQLIKSLQADKIIYQNNTLHFKVGNFIFNTNDKYIYNDPKRTEWAEEISDIKNYGQYGECGDAVGKISNIVVSQKVDLPLNQELAGYISIYAWNEKETNFINENTKNRFKTFEKSLGNLSNKTGDPIQNPINLDLGPFLSCSGIYSIPLKVQRIDNNKFDSVFYAEVIEGNGSYHTPSKKLVLHNKENWMIYTESAYGGDYENYNDCYQDSDNDNSRLNCVIKRWKDKYRNQKDIDSWIDKAISTLEFKN